MSPQNLLPPWPESLPSTLADLLEKEMLLPIGLSVAAYCTDAFLTPNKESRTGELKRRVMWTSRIETLSVETARRFVPLGIRFPPQTDPPEASEALRKVDVLLSVDSGIRSSVETFVLAIHLIESEGPNYDCSFSDPEIPFSIFLSLPPVGEANRTLRLLEAVVHETMHLQLTAFERLTPTVFENGDETWFSPWKKSRRKIGGILHGMYVFRSLEFMYTALIASGLLEEVDDVFARRRVNTITKELGELRGVEESEALTRAGTTLLRAIMNSGFNCADI